MFTDDDRRLMYDALEHSLGPEAARIVMGHLPPVGWVDFATKSDIAELKGEIARLEGRIDSMVPKMIAANFASIIGAAGLVIAAISIGR